RLAQRSDALELEIGGAREDRLQIVEMMKDEAKGNSRPPGYFHRGRLRDAFVEQIQHRLGERAARAVAAGGAPVPGNCAGIVHVRQYYFSVNANTSLGMRRSPPVESGSGGLSFRAHDLEQVHRDSERQSPDGLAAVQNRRELRSIGAPSVFAAVAGIGERADWHLEDLGHLVKAWAQPGCGGDYAREGSHGDSAGQGAHLGKRAEHVHGMRLDSDFLARLAKRGIEQGRIRGIDASAGKRNLSAMARYMVGAADVHHVQFTAPLADWNQHGGAPRVVRELFAGNGRFLRERTAQPLDIMAVGERFPGFVRLCHGFKPSWSGYRAQAGLDRATAARKLISLPRGQVLARLNRQCAT